MTIDRLISMRNHVFGFGGLQLIITTAVIGYLTYAFGLSDAKTALIVGCALALSSTAMVIGALNEQGNQSSQAGRLSIAVLLMQDFAVVPLLILVPLLNDTDSSIMITIVRSMLEACLGMLIVFFAGRMVIRPLYRLIVATKNDKLFTATTLLLVLGAAYATHSFNLSLALGAFIAGLLVAETQYNLQVEESVKPFKGLLLGLFFTSVGMTINLSFIIDNIIKILIYSSLLLVIKASIIIFLCKLFRFKFGASIQSGLLLAQGGEFAFILFTLAQQEQLFDYEYALLLLMVVTTTMAVTPLMAHYSTRIAAKYDHRDIEIAKSKDELSDMEKFVVICGFGRVGRMVSRIFSEHRINYIVLDIDADTVTNGQKNGYPIYKGDASRMQSLKHINMQRAKAVIFTVPNYLTCIRSLTNIRKLCPDIPIIVRAEDLKDSNNLKKHGATAIVPETYETGLQLGGELLKSIGVSTFNISQVKNQFRAGNYAWAKEIIPEDEEESNNKVTNENF